MPMGKLTAQVQQAKFDKEFAKNAMQGKIDSIAYELKIKPKNIKEVQQATIKTERTGINVPFVVHDTVFGTMIDSSLKEFNYKDNWINIVGDMRQNANSINFDTIQTYSNLTITHFEQRKHWYSLGKTIQVTVKDDNPYVKNISLNSFEIQDKPKKFGVYVGGMYGFDGEKLKPMIGIGIGWKLFEF